MEERITVLSLDLKLILKNKTTSLYNMKQFFWFSWKNDILMT
jgi:hypothetical protein